MPHLADQLSHQSGSFRPLKVILPPGTVVSAVKPAAMRWWMTYPMTVVDTIFKALAPAIPDRVIAGHHADLVCALIHGRQQADNRMFLYLGGLIGGGWGAKHNEDGVSATICINDGDTHNGPSEQVEAKYPLLVESYGLRDDSGGAGRHRGGLGTRQVVRALRDIMFNAQIERVKCRPWGLYDGLSGSGNEVVIERADGTAEHHETGKVLSRLLRAGDAYVLASGGGGGFGSPLERAPEAVARDVAQGYVSRRSAHALYGVLFSPDGQEVDLAATDALRERMCAVGLPCDEAAAAPGGDDAASAPQVEPWRSPAGASAGGIVIEADRPRGAAEAELAQWRNEIRWAGLLRVRCGCCG